MMRGYTPRMSETQRLLHIPAGGLPDMTHRTRTVVRRDYAAVRAMEPRRDCRLRRHEPATRRTLMTANQIVAIVLIIAGVLGLAYGSFSFTKETHEAKIGPLQFSVKEK